jgi:HAD superfamily hydrolase (TIGR01450 family)
VQLAASGRPLVYVTNNPGSTRAEFAARLTELGAPTDPSRILTSATATARVLAAEHPGAMVLSIGTESLGLELNDVGLQPITVAEFAGAASPAPAAVVVGGGGAGFDFDTLRVASTAAREGAELWATNIDPTYPSARGLVPGTGAIVAAIETASGVKAINVGKPEPLLFEQALELLGLDRERASAALMAGDTLHSDIAGAAGVGMRTALILTGRDGREDIAAAPIAPDHVFEDLAALTAALA